MSDPSPTSDNPSPDRETRIRQLVDRVRKASIAGKKWNVEAVCARFPDFLPELEVELRKLQVVLGGMKKAKAEQAISPSGATPPETTDPNGTEDHLPASPPAHSPLPGTPTKVRYIGDYEIIEEIGRGGMGVIYKARQVSLKRLVALKMIRAGALAGAEEVKRFQIEAEAVAKLEHRHIVPIYEVGRHQGLPYFSMAFVQGRSLHEIIRDNPLAPKAAAEYMLKVVEAIAYAHGQGLLHRDIKPQNILVDEHDEPRVTDFGLAKRVGDLSQLTFSGQVLGTPSYMPPEQAIGHHPQIGEASDVYSLGATLYALLTGRPPFQAEDAAATIYQVVSQEPVSPRRLVPQLDRDIETITLKCLEKSIGRRYPTATALRDDLHNYLKGIPIKARPIGSIGRTLRWCRRNRAVAALMTLVAASLILGTVVSTYFGVDASRRAVTETAAKTDAREKQREAEKQTKRADTESQRAKDEAQRAKDAALLAQKNEAAAKAEARKAYRNYYIAQTSMAQIEWDQGSTSSTSRRLEQTQPEHTGGEDFRGFEWYLLSEWPKQGHVDIGEIRDCGDALGLSRDAQRIVSGGRGAVRLWNANTGEQICTLGEHNPYVYGVALSDDGKLIASGSHDGTVKVWDVDERRELRTIRAHKNRVTCVAFSPNGNMIFSGSYDGTVRSWDSQTGNEMRTLLVPSMVVSVSVSPDGTRVASGSYDSTVRLWDVETGNSVFNLNGHTSVVSCIAFSPDGKRIVSGAQDNTLKIWDVETGRELHTLKGHYGNVESAAWSHDGMKVISGSRDESLILWDTTTGQEIRRLRGHIGGVFNVAFAPDDKRVISQGGYGTIKLWDLENGQDFPTIQGMQFLFQNISLSRDGKLVASEYESKDVCVCDARTGQQLQRLDGHQMSIHCVAISSDGKWIATGSQDTTVKVWDAATGREVRIFTEHASPVLSVVFTADGKRVISGSGDGALKLWDAETGDVIQMFQGTPQSRRLTIACSPAMHRIVSVGMTGTIHLWEADTGKQLKEVRVHSGVMSVAFSPDGEWFATGGYDRTVKVWDAETGDERMTLEGHKGEVNSVAISPDGNRIASGSNDKQVKLWDAETGAEVTHYRGFGQVDSLAFSPDGRRLYVGSKEITILGSWYPPPTLGADESRSSPSSDSRVATFLDADGTHWESDDLDGEKQLVVRNGSGDHWLLFGDPAWTDYDFSFEARHDGYPSGITAVFRASTDSQFQHFGVGWLDFQTDLLEVADEKQRFRKCVANGRELVNRRDETLVGDRWYKINVSVRGKSVVCSCDDHEIFRFDDNPYDHGRVGVRTFRQWSGATRFRNFLVTAPDKSILWEGVPELPEPKASP